MNEAKQLLTGFVETNGTKLYYEMMGEGQPLVLGLYFKTPNDSILRCMLHAYIMGEELGVDEQYSSNMLLTNGHSLFTF